MKWLYRVGHEDKNLFGQNSDYILVAYFHDEDEAFRYIKNTNATSLYRYGKENGERIVQQYDFSQKKFI